MSCETALTAVCDVLVLKAVESVGKRIVRMDRSRFRFLAETPLHLAHTIWEADDATVSKALRGAWDVVPPLIDTHMDGCGVTAEHVTRVLDDYVHDLCITGTPHSIQELHYRFRTRLHFTAEHEEDGDEDEKDGEVLMSYGSPVGKLGADDNDNEAVRP